MQSDDRQGISISMFGMLIFDPPAADVGGRSGGGQFRQQIFIVSLMVRVARAGPRGLGPAILRYKLRAWSRLNSAQTPNGEICETERATRVEQTQRERDDQKRSYLYLPTSFFLFILFI